MARGDPGRPAAPHSCRRLPELQSVEGLPMVCLPTPAFLSGCAPLAFCPPRLTHKAVGQWLANARTCPHCGPVHHTPGDHCSSEIPCHVRLRSQGLSYRAWPHGRLTGVLVMERLCTGRRRLTPRLLHRLPQGLASGSILKREVSKQVGSRHLLH